jgi:hypothetical protein
MHRVQQKVFVMRAIQNNIILVFAAGDLVVFTYPAAFKSHQ